MTEIFIMTKGHNFWNATIEFAEKCSWGAGPFLAKRMQEGAFSEDERVIVTVIDGNIAGYCTFAHKDELPEEYDFTPFIGFMFVKESYRGNRLSEQMIDTVCDYAKELGYKKVYIMSGEIGLYEKYGFVKLGDYRTIYGTVDQLFIRNI